MIFLIFDLIACPFIDNEYKRRLLFYYGVVDSSEKEEIINFILKNKLYFFEWKNTNFSRNILKKKKNEVY
jgi:hypothetical protein